MPMGIGPLRPIVKPSPGEYPPYAEMYMKFLPDDGRVLTHLRENFDTTWTFIRSLPEPLLYFRYAPGKWSIKDILVHIVDDERIYAYRALRFARQEQQNLVGFDENAYAQQAEADRRDLDNIFEEYRAVREATIALFNGLPEASLTRMGHGTGSAHDATVRALAYHIAGHELHHLQVIRDRYLR
jgi:uncharacterized damage-inducible protein DinB